MSDVFVGRDDELATLAGAVARGGRLVLISGEPGIGKTRLVEELARRTAAVRFVWGRSWEGPGTPAYWPWLQALRELDLAALLDATEIGDRQEARFAMFDALATRLFAYAGPIAIVLDDLHAADIATLELLRFVARGMRPSGLTIVATSRDSWFHATRQSSDLLAKIAREAMHLPLGRLGLDDVEAWIAAAAPQLAERAGPLFDASEGNPLFVGELVAAATHARHALPHSVRDAVRAHLELLSAPTAEALALAAVHGRDVPLAVVPRAAIDEASTLGIVAVRDARVRFTHVLLRDELYASLPAERRAAQHRAIAQDAIDPMIAAHHHLLAADPGAIDAVRAAMRDATTRLAFDDAARLGDRALAELALEPTTACDLGIAIGEAWMLAGNRAAGHAAALRAAEVATAIGDPARVARASLIAAEVVVLGRDQRIIDLLRRALAMQPDEPSALRAELMARLSMAMLPSPPDEAPEQIRLREDAIVMARRAGDEPALLLALRLATHTFPETIPVRERFAFNAEALALADRLGRVAHVVGMFQGQIGCHLELGDLDGAEREAAAAERRLAAFRQPSFRWRAPLLRALLAGLAGRFADAEACCREAVAIGREHDVFEAQLLAGIARTMIAYNRGDDEGYAEYGELVFALQARTAGPGPYSAIMSAAMFDVERTRATLDASVGIPLGVMPGSVALAGAAIRTGLLDHAKRFYAVGRDHFGRMTMTFGPSGTSGPTALVLGQLAAIAGDDAAVEPHFTAALALSEQLRARPYIAQTQLAWAEVLASRGARDAACRRAEIAATIATELGMTRVASSAAAVLGTAAPARAPKPARPTPRRAIAIARRGAMWAIGEITVKDAKGFAYLEMLVRDPGREIHVLDLIGADADGDAGPMLDAAAKQAYRDRAEELEVAIANQDLGRAERARAELEAITDELARAVGLGGRDRRAASQSERARINVQRRVRDAIRRIAELDPDLARHFELSVKTGAFCSYTPVWPG